MGCPSALFTESAVHCVLNQAASARALGARDTSQPRPRAANAQVLGSGTGAGFQGTGSKLVYDSVSVVWYCKVGADQPFNPADTLKM